MGVYSKEAAEKLSADKEFSAHFAKVPKVDMNAKKFKFKEMLAKATKSEEPEDVKEAVDMADIKEKLDDQKEKDLESSFKTDMFYGNAQVVVKARNERETEMFQKFAQNDFQRLKESYSPASGYTADYIVAEAVDNGTKFFIWTKNSEDNRQLDEVTIRNGLCAKKSHVDSNDIQNFLNDKYSV